LYNRVKKSVQSFEKSKVFNIPEYGEEQESMFHQKTDELNYKKMILTKTLNLIEHEIFELTAE